MRSTITILPADTYTVVNKTVLSENDHKLITMLYQPIIGHTATSLYFTLIDDLDKRKIISNDLTHYHLMTTMQLKLDDILLAREKLEAAGLLKTYYKEDHVNQYVYLLFSPLSPNEFLLLKDSFELYPRTLSAPSSKSFGISFINLEIKLQLVEPNIVRCLLHVKNKSFLALVIPT